MTVTRIGERVGRGAFSRDLRLRGALGVELANPFACRLYAARDGAK